MAQARVHSLLSCLYWHLRERKWGKDSRQGAEGQAAQELIQQLYSWWDALSILTLTEMDSEGRRIMSVLQRSPSFAFFLSF